MKIVKEDEIWSRKTERSRKKKGETYKASITYNVPTSKY